MKTTRCFFVSDLHGDELRYRALFEASRREKPAAVFLGGDLFPSGRFALSAAVRLDRDFLQEVLLAGFGRLKDQLGDFYPQVYLIQGNDDPRILESELRAGALHGIWRYLHQQRARFGDFIVYGYACVPPTPFLMKDWERYDVSRFVDPGCIPLEEGQRTLDIPENELIYTTIQEDLDRLVGLVDLSRAIFLFHAPPYRTVLDRAALDDRTVDGVPLDVHVGSIAIRRLIETRQPLITLHGHIHESTRLTGSWVQKIGRTFSFSAAHDGPELALVRFDPQAPHLASRELIRLSRF